MTHRVLVVGLGNVLMCDDGVGPYCVEHLIANYDWPADVHVTDLGTPGLDLTVHLSSADAVVAVDALQGIEPGAVEVFHDDELMTGQSGARLDTHAPALGEAILIARLSSGRPHDVRLVGIGGVRFEHGTTLSEVVRGHMDVLCERVLAELTTLDVGWLQHESHVRPDIWWDKDEKGFLCAQ